MGRRTRLLMLMAVLVVAPFAIACGAAEEPAGEEPAAEEPAAEEPAAEPAPAPTTPETTAAAAEEPADTGPQEPQLVGEIRIADENFDWGETTAESAAYTWTARVTNDTTATLNITVRFEFLDEQDQVIKTESATVRLDPAQSRRINQGGNMDYAQANRVYSFRAVTDYKIVES